MSEKENLQLLLESIQKTGKIPADAPEKWTEDETELVRQLHKEGLVGEALRLIKDLDANQDWLVLKEKMTSSKKRTVPLWKSVSKYAAVFLGILLLAYFYHATERADTTDEIPDRSVRLKIGGDEIRTIDEGETRQLVSSSGKVVGQQQGNLISHTKADDTDVLVYNELEVPYGKIFDVELSDGTMVHLNSGTKMRYPVRFLEGGKREVFIDGEAYFEVVKDEKHPFIVNADAVAVEVIGTEFNVSSYAEDLDIKTVLVAGSVAMTNSAAPEDKIVLRPGQKGAWNKMAHNTEVEQVEVGLYTGWIRGEMIFRNMPFEDMALKLERHYDVDIQNTDALLGKKMLNARFNVNVEDIEDVMNALKEIEKFEYHIDGRRVVID